MRCYPADMVVNSVLLEASIIPKQTSHQLECGSWLNAVLPHACNHCRSLVSSILVEGQCFEEVPVLKVFMILFLPIGIFIWFLGHFVTCAGPTGFLSPIMRPFQETTGAGQTATVPSTTSYRITVVGLEYSAAFPQGVKNDLCHNYEDHFKA